MNNLSPELLAAVAATSLAAMAVSLVLLAASAVHTNAGAPRVVGEPPRDMLEAAFLAGGPGRVADTVLCSMRQDGRLAVDGGNVRVIRPVGMVPVERELLALCGPEWGRPLESLRVELMRSPSVQVFGDALAQRGLLWRPDQRKLWRIASKLHTSVCMTAVLLFILPRWLGGAAPSGVEFAVIPGAVVSMIVGGVLSPSRSRLTRAGRRALAGVRTHNPWAPDGATGPGSYAALLAVGGPRAMPDSLLSSQLLQAARSAHSGRGAHFSGGSADGFSDGSASWCGSSGGGGCGAGGGGCGGSGGSGCGGSGGGCGGSSGGGGCGGGGGGGGGF